MQSVRVAYEKLLTELWLSCYSGKSLYLKGLKYNCWNLFNWSMLLLVSSGSSNLFWTFIIQKWYWTSGVYDYGTYSGEPLSHNTTKAWTFILSLFSWSFKTKLNTRFQSSKSNPYTQKQGISASITLLVQIWTYPQGEITLSAPRAEHTEQMVLARFLALSV